MHKAELADRGLDPSPPLALLALPQVLPADISLATWALRYLTSEVQGVRAQNTLEAKVRDLRTFLAWFLEANGHLAIASWLPRDTQAYLGHLEALGRKPSTINRHLATLRRFARWVLEQPESPLRAGLPTKGVHELVGDEPPVRRLSRKDLFRVFKAADNLVLTETRKNARPHRNRAILGLLYFTGLRVSELCALELAQLGEKHLQEVRRKGKTRSRVYLQKEARELLNEYLERERDLDDPEREHPWLFLPTGGGRPLTRVNVGHLLRGIAEEASKHTQKPIRLHPHMLRHSFGWEVRQRTGSDTETAALLGHAGTKYVGRYARDTDAVREAVLDGLSIQGGTRPD